MNDPVAALPFAHGGPPLCAHLRTQPEDFEVEEISGFEPTGSGEHAWLWLEKTGANTEWVAGQLAAAAGVAPAAVGFAGLKDRHALARQAFTVHVPGSDGPDWQALDIPGVRVLAAGRHDRKLRRGGHRGNRFRITLREVSGPHALLEERLAAVRARGVPNYFGSQRFGRAGNNLRLAHQLFAGRRLARNQRGHALSAARAEVFNAVLARRVHDGSWDRALDGEVWMLAGTRSIFGPVPFDDELGARLAAADIHPTGPLWGRGTLRSGGAVQALEEGVATGLRQLADGLEHAGLEQERRALRLAPGGLRHALDGSTLVLEFSLPGGAYATSVVRELAATRDLAAG